MLLGERLQAPVTRVLIPILRHGEKNNQGHITPEGTARLLAQRQHILLPTGSVKWYTSSAPRAQETASVLSLSDSTRGKLPRIRRRFSTSALRQGVTGIISSPFLNSYHRSWLDAYNRASTESEREKVIRGIEAKQLHHYLRFGRRRPDIETSSPREVADEISHGVDKIISIAQRLPPGTQATLGIITHAEHIGAFMKYSMRRGRWMLWRRNYYIGYGEGPVLDVQIDRRGRKKIRISYAEAKQEPTVRQKAA